MSFAYIITHPEVVIDPNVPVIEWSVSELGRKRTTAMLDQPWVKTLDLVYSSEERKAYQTAEIIANTLEIPLHTHSKLGEVNRSSTGFLEENELNKTVREFFSHPDKSIAGWEMANIAQERIVHTFSTVLQSHPEKTLGIVTHGMVSALLISYLKKVPIHQRYMQKQLGSYFIFDTAEQTIIQEWRSINDHF